MNNNVEKYLPLGSVVLLKEAKKRIMVIGFMGRAQETGDKTFDYIGCLYPEGILSSDKNLMFNHDQIDKIFYLGLVDDEQRGFQLKLKNLEKEINGEVEPVAQPIEQSVVQPTQNDVPPVNTMEYSTPFQQNVSGMQQPQLNSLFDNINQ